MERSIAGMKEKEVLTAYHYLSNTIIINIIWYYFITCGKRTMKCN